MNVGYVNELAEAAYKNAKDHGFCDVADEPAVSHAMLHCELSEALQEDRNGMPMVYVVAIDIFGLRRIQEIKQNHYWTDKFKPEGVAVELADFVIRLLVFCKQNNMELPEIDTGTTDFETLPRLVVHMHRELTLMQNYSVITSYATACIIYRMIQDVEHFLAQQEVSLWDVVHMKMEYNRHRPPLHGKKY